MSDKDKETSLDELVRYDMVGCYGDNEIVPYSAGDYVKFEDVRAMLSNRRISGY